MEDESRPLGVARLAAVYLLVGLMVAFSRPAPPSLVVGTAFVLVGELIRLWASGHLVKTRRLVTSGPYAYARNPLYLGRLLLFTGLCIATRLPWGLTWWLLPAGYAVFFGYYLPRKERVEPARLRQRHGATYDAYFSAVPSLWPRHRRWSGAATDRWSLERSLANREHLMVLALAALLAFLTLRAAAG